MSQLLPVMLSGHSVVVFGDTILISNTMVTIAIMHNTTTPVSISFTLNDTSKYS